MPQEMVTHEACMIPMVLILPKLGSVLDQRSQQEIQILCFLSKFSHMLRNVTVKVKKITNLLKQRQ